MTTPSLAEPVTERPDWRDSLGTAADLAVWGIVMFFGCLLAVTAGATVAAASTAVDQWCRTRTMPSAYESWQTARRGALAGLAAVVFAIAVGALLVVDLRLLAAGAIPGGAPAVAAIGFVSAGFVAALAVTVVRIGQTGGNGWLAAVRWSLRLLRDRPLTGPGVVGTVALAFILGLVMPVTSVLLPGFVLFALHAVVRRADGRRARSAMDDQIASNASISAAATTHRNAG